MPTKPSQFRLSPETLADLDAIAEEQQLPSRTEAIRFAVSAVRKGKTFSRELQAVLSPDSESIAILDDGELTCYQFAMNTKYKIVWIGDYQIDTFSMKCSCPGFMKHGRCKHVAAIKALGV